VLRPRGHSAKTAGENKQDVDPGNVQNRPMKEENVDDFAVIDGMYFGAPRPEYHREKLDSATKGARINTFLVSETRTSMSQVDCKG
jgi:hypothetical protein